MTYFYQKGFVSILLVAILTSVVALWVSTQHQSLISYFKTEQIDERYLALKSAKQKLLQFAILQPEIYQTNSDSKLLPAGEVPSIGYFPCPDLDGDGRLLVSETMCGRKYDATSPYPEKTGFAPDPERDEGVMDCNGSAPCMGFLPSIFKSRFVYFGPAKRFYFVLDERFAFQNPNYNSGESQYFAPLSKAEIDRQSQIATDPVPVGLSLDNTDGYVAILIDAGDDGLNSENSDGDRFFRSAASSTSMKQVKEADLVLGISYQEWQKLVVRRLCVASQRWQGISADFERLKDSTPHWANPYNASINSYGSGIKSWVGSCQF